MPFPTLDNFCSTLSGLLRGIEHDPYDTSDASLLIDHLADRIADYEIGDMSKEELFQEFSKYDLNGFDLQLWINDMVREGYYADD